MRKTLARIVIVSCAATAVAQLDRASLEGTITDPSGAVVPNARVEVVSASTGFKRQVIAGPDGTYTAPLLPVGTYTVVVSHPGFSTTTVTGVRLAVGDKRELDIKLPVSAVESAVKVEASAIVLNATDATIGNVITTEQMREIPLNGRHWASLMALAPGAINTGEGNQQSIRFVGRARDDNNWTFDGLDATGVKDPRQESALRLVISTDSIAEFRVNSTLYSAESGSGAGGQV
ncbi:MAG TPA: carboxypeptidase-like regulatory domain-containing protein, partial [Bryobacteraceae bacterium]|nr:carboxypeptidase-like regulatory domain-containing protein [Bryobacteraceae bacterium]